MSVSLVGTAILPSDMCACGKPIADHRCPSSQGYAPRVPKTASCRACGEKAHQNLERTTVSLECLWRQWSRATGQTTVKGARLILPDVTANNVADFYGWLAQTARGQQAHPTTGIIAAPPATMNPDGTFQQPDTAAVLKRMSQRAAGAAPMPADAPEPQEDAREDTVGLDVMAPTTDVPATTLPPLPEIILDTDFTLQAPDAPADYSDLI